MDQGAQAPAEAVQVRGGSLGLRRRSLGLPGATVDLGYRLTSKRNPPLPRERASRTPTAGVHPGPSIAKELADQAPAVGDDRAAMAMVPRSARPNEWTLAFNTAKGQHLFIMSGARS